MATEKEYKRKLFNKGARTIRFHRDLEQLDPKTHKPLFVVHELPPQKAGAFSEEEAKRMLRLYKHELIDMENVTVESLTGSGLADKAAQDSKEQAEAIAMRLANARHMKAEKAYEAARAEGFSDDDARDIAGLPALTDAERASRDALTSEGQKPPVAKE